MKNRATAAAAGGARAVGDGEVWRRGWDGYLEDRDTASRGPTTIVTPKSQFRTCPSDHGKAPSNIAPGSLGITDSACKNQLVVVSVQYGPFNTYIPIRSTTIGKPIYLKHIQYSGQRFITLLSPQIALDIHAYKRAVNPRQ
ncbi:hypothetical protein F511_38844 [Dorcoceras hygrometricum]|uniref:Uncharacterized protein n=1 Tax=Dorcoceras hygrometricum TaxID=472368 RepID=A0A2Z7B814_9LAMI|nr:hypothetical protein F511_38844 [Dorcoceras hygrometricum]